MHYVFLPKLNMKQTINRMVLQCLRLFPKGFTRNILTNGSCHLASTSLQNTVPGSPKCLGIFRQAQHPGGYLPALLPDFAPCDVFLFHKLMIMLKVKNFKMKIIPKGKKISRHRRDTTEYDKAAAAHSEQVYHTWN
jgi:hypothetical protein